MSGFPNPRTDFSNILFGTFSDVAEKVVQNYRTVEARTIAMHNAVDKLTKISSLKVTEALMDAVKISAGVMGASVKEGSALVRAVSNLLEAPFRETLTAQHQRPVGKFDL